MIYTSSDCLWYKIKVSIFVFTKLYSGKVLLVESVCVLYGESGECNMMVGKESLYRYLSPHYLSITIHLRVKFQIKIYKSNK
jgi:hypothetical protein